MIPALENLRKNLARPAVIALFGLALFCFLYFLKAAPWSSEPKVPSAAKIKNPLRKQFVKNRETLLQARGASLTPDNSSTRAHASFRDRYRRFLILDLFFPFAYVGLLAGLIGLGSFSPRWKPFALWIPLAAFPLDWLENGLLLHALHAEGLSGAAIESFSRLAAVVKMVLYGVFAVSGGLALWALASRFIRRGR